MRPSIAILSLGASNRASIAQAVERGGGAPSFADSPGDLLEAHAIIFPGVANFGYLCAALDRRSLREPLLEALRAGTPYLGICAGFQLLYSGSDEAPEARGLGYLAGRIRKLTGPKSPHMGWNQVAPTLGATLISPGWAYFSHDYAPEHDTSQDIATATYGEATFPCAAARSTAIGVQFHPERSGEYGSLFLRSFISRIGARDAS
ncbi:MAG: imidazole glycerol phosphate synthase subunit HisH [Candidatus Eremiobacteraeota bacterium]|nr:imidazole glycerol phosphate synthase subunit HisH [Candidatus Eremiobacteraeota bacterium]